MKNFKRNIRLFALLMAFVALFTGIFTGDLEFTTLGISLLVIITVGEMAEKIAKIEKGMEK